MPSVVIDPSPSEWTEAVRWAMFNSHRRARENAIFSLICYVGLAAWLVMVARADHANRATSIFEYVLAGAFALLVAQSYYRALFARPRASLELYRKLGPHRFTFSSAGISYEAPDVSMTLAWPAFTGYVHLGQSFVLPRPNSTYFVIARSAFTDDQWSVVDALIVTNLKPRSSVKD